MTRTALSGFAILGALAVSPAAATPLPFGGLHIAAAPVTHIRNWYAPNDKTLYVQSQAREWYKADMARPCWGMPEAKSVKVNMPDGALDASSTVAVHGERCRVASLYRVNGPVQPLSAVAYL